MFVAVDPGWSGCLVCPSSVCSEQVQAIKCPDNEFEIYNLLRDLNTEWHIAEVVFENVYPQPGNGIKQASSFMTNITAWKMSTYFLEIPLTLVSPVRWQKPYNVPTTKSVGKDAHKKALIAKACERFPYLKVTKWNADGLLIYDFWANQLRTKENVREPGCGCR